MDQVEMGRRRPRLGFRNKLHFFSWLAEHAPDDQKDDLEHALENADKAGVDWMKILAAILPLILSLFSGGSVDWQKVIAAILALFNKP